ncbi:MAG: hypothetical protein KDG89_13335, partial [Geminicoccaceae bacterium]|nr:hypothetical protein [Geminicoccaceae bacterium]
ETREAVGLHEQHLAIAREIGDRRGEGIALYNGGDKLAKLGKTEEAAGRVREALAVFRAIESPHAATAAAWLRERGVAVEG